MLVGAALATVGFIVASFTTSFWLVFLFYGIVAGEEHVVLLKTDTEPWAPAGGGCVKCPKFRL